MIFNGCEPTGIHWDFVGVMACPCASKPARWHPLWFTPQENRKKQKEGDSLCGPNGRGIWEDPWEDLQPLQKNLTVLKKVAPRREDRLVFFFFYLTDHWDLSRDSVTRTETRAGMCENTACGRCFFHSNPWAFSSRPRLTTGGFSILCPKTCGSRQKKNPRKFAGAYGSQIIIVGGLYPIYFWCFSPSYSLSILQIHIWNQRNSQNILET